MSELVEPRVLREYAFIADGERGALVGPAKVTVVLDVRARYGREAMRSLTLADGAWSGQHGDFRFRWSGAAGARQLGDGALAMTLNLAAGARHDLVLELSDGPFDQGPPDPDAAWRATEGTWSSLVPDCDDLVAARDARHAFAILRGLTASSGAMVAAATTSLPERLESRRNYDYRFAWIRDQCYAGVAVASHGPHPLLAGTLRFLTERVLADGPRLAPAYTVTGERIPGEQALRLRGYPGGTAVAGNRVRDQFQLDCLGEILQVIAAAARHDMLTAENWRAAEVAATAISERCSEAEAGLWELDDRHWTHSRLACVAGLKSIAAVARGAPDGHGFRRAADWSAQADKILGSLGDCVHTTGRWQRSPDDDRVDASLLLPMIRGAVATEDPRSRATLRAITDELADDGYLYRFHHDGRPLHKAEGAFLLCGFWMAQALHLCGDRVAAGRWFERNRAACGPAGLYTEEYDVHQRQLRGNLPQAFVHAALLEGAVTLAADRNADEGWRG